MINLEFALLGFKIMLKILKSSMITRIFQNGGKMTIQIKHKHPGIILREYYLKELNISAYKLAKATNMAQIRVSEILKGKRSITANTALRLSKFFGNSFQYWMNLQNNYDKSKIKKTELNRIKSIQQYGQIQDSVT